MNLTHPETNRFHRSLPFIGVALLLLFSFVFLRTAPIFQDIENRWQRFFYDVHLSLPGQQSYQEFPIYLVELDDASLPPQSCRSPVDQIWLRDLLVAIGQQGPGSIGLNLNLETGERVQPKLLKVIKDLDNVVVLTSPDQTGFSELRKSARSWGSMVYRTNSAGDIQEVCDSAVQCICSTGLECGDQRVFFREMLKLQGLPKVGPAQENAWLKLFVGQSVENLRTSEGNAPWIRISASDLLALSPSQLLPNALFIVGPVFQGIYPTYTLPVRQTGTLPSQRINGLELVALTIDRVQKNEILQPFSLAMELLMLSVCFFAIASISRSYHSFRPVWGALILIFCWNSLAALLFSSFMLELSAVMPSLILFLFGLYCLRHQQVMARFEQLSLENRLEKERFNGLIDKFHSHSVFNAMEHIRYLIRTQDNTVEEYILNYSTLLLDDLSHNAREFYPVLAQWEYVLNYLRLQNLKQKEKISVVVDEIDEPAFQGVTLPWKLFYPLVENAFKYARAGIDATEEQPQVQLGMKRQEGQLHFRVRNPYSKAAKPVGSGQGIINLKKRLSLLYPGSSWKLEHSDDGYHWESHLILPIKSRKQD